MEGFSVWKLLPRAGALGLQSALPAYSFLRSCCASVVMGMRRTLRLRRSLGQAQTSKRLRMLGGRA
jgi:hypothetical protein